MKKSILFLSLFTLSFIVKAQSIIDSVPFVNIGPTIMSGRVVDVDVNPDNTTEFYVAYASGGLWYTNNNGTSFTAMTENAPTQNMGDIAVDWKNGTIWLGTGESNSSRSSYSGHGMLKSTDKGKTWAKVGLKDSHHIGRVIINKENTNEVVVGVVGRLYTPNTERGIFKTKDGGLTWTNTLFIDENTGIIDVSVSPTNSNIMYAASWERTRKAWNFDGDGQHSAIYKSIDSGDSWAKITNGANGFPSNKGIGRIGLTVFKDDVIYAVLDNQNRRPKEKKEKKDKLEKSAIKTMNVVDFSKLDDEKLNTYLLENGFDEKHTAKSVKLSIKKGEIKPIDLATYFEDANSLLFDTPVIGAEVYKSIDGGATWRKTHDGYLDDLFYSYGYYFGIIGVNTSHENNIYIGGVPLLKSADGGKTFTSIGKENVHGDHQALWINPKQKGHIINGNDGGVNITYDDGENWIKNNAQSVGQYYAINVDNAKPYNVFGGLQDNGVWYGPSTYKASKSWNNSGDYPYKMIGWGDGMQVQIDSRDNNIVYSGSQFGYYYRYNLKTKNRLPIHPMHKLGESPYRYNWQTPILLSPHNQDILYMGANRLLRSMDKGKSFKEISGDLTTSGKKGNVPFGTLTAISESPLLFGMIYTGSDDGYVWFTKDGGNSWTKISDNLPQELWVSRVIASQHKKDRVYVTLNGYRNDDFKPYVFLSEGNGNTWKNISSNLPNYPVNVIKEDPSDENILYLGNDNEVLVSFNKGENWQVFTKGIPKVAVHDLVIQEREKELLVGTHGRSIYKADITALQQYNTVKNNDITIFELPKVNHSSRWGGSWSQFSEVFLPKVTIAFFVKETGDYTIEILGNKNKLLQKFTIKATKGFNYFDYDLTVSEKSIKKYFSKNKIEIEKAKNNLYYLPKGEYTIKIHDAQNKASQELVIK